MDVAQGVKTPFPKLVATNCVGFYSYQALMCPMELLERRRSAMHNFYSGMIIGYLGVQKGMLGIPFLPPSFFYQYPRVNPPVAGAFVYGAIGCAMGVFNGKPF